LPKSPKPPPIKTIKPKPNQTNVAQNKTFYRHNAHQVQPCSIKMSASDPNFQFNQKDFNKKFESVQINSPKVSEENEARNEEIIIETEQDEEEEEVLSDSGSDKIDENQALNDQVDLYQLHVDMYADAIEELNMKPPRWRVIYENTGRLDIKFKGVKQLKVNAMNINNLKFKYLDESKTRIDLNDRTNKLFRLLLTYLKKKYKTPSTSSAPSSMPMTTQQATRIDPSALSSLSYHRIQQDSFKQESMEVDQTRAAQQFTKVDDDLLRFLIDKIKQRLENFTDDSSS
jgi:hypothetical protein